MNTTKAYRPVYIVSEKNKQVFYEEELEFNWHKGMSWQVRQRSSDELAKSIKDKYPQLAGKILEVSTKSHDFELGQKLSAVNLMYTDYETERTCSVENWFQSAKWFQTGGDLIDDSEKIGPFEELLKIAPTDAKRFLNQKLDKKTAEQYNNNSLFEEIQSKIKRAHFKGFSLSGKEFPTKPKSIFYDYLYCRALNQEHNGELASQLLGFSAFTDITFTPKDSRGNIVRYNTQARSCAIFVSISRRDTLQIALEDIDSFRDLVGYEDTRHNDS